MFYPKLFHFIFIATLFFTGAVNADWMEAVKKTAENVVEGQGGEVAKSALSNSEVVEGLKEALGNGVEKAIKALGQSGGFSNNEAVKISVPDSLSQVASGARLLGQGEYVDTLETTMNQAAEQAVPQAAEILSGSIKQMSVDDAMNILNGPDDAATNYFRKVSGASLTEKFKPVISDATDKVGVTAAYKNLTSQAGVIAEQLTENSALDLDQYITDKSMDGLFKYIASEEKQIRSNPAARTTDLLKKVFAN